MASILASTLRAGKKIQDSAGGDPHLSKVVELNNSYRLFFRVKWFEENTPELIAGLVPGRVLDRDVVKASFIPFRAGMFEFTDSDDIIDLTGLDRWARIAKVLHKAQCVREKKLKEMETEKAATDLGAPVDRVTLQRELDKIELLYNGGEAADGTKIYAKKSPMISNIKRKMTTQVGVVKLLPSGAPDLKGMKYATLELSSTRVDDLLKLLSDANYIVPGVEYLEVGYTYSGADKQAAGRAASFQGITQAIGLEAAYPLEWSKGVGKFVENIANGDNADDIANIMVSRNRNLSSSKTATDIISACREWCAKNIAVFTAINFEDDSTKYAAKDFLELNILDGAPAVKKHFEELAESLDKKDSEDNNVEETSTVDAVDEKSELQEAAALAGNQAPSTLQQIVAASSALELDADDGLGELE